MDKKKVPVVTDMVTVKSVGKVLVNDSPRILLQKNKVHGIVVGKVYVDKTRITLLVASEEKDLVACRSALFQ